MSTSIMEVPKAMRNSKYLRHFRGNSNSNKSERLLSSYYVPGPVLSALHALLHLILTTCKKGQPF